MNNDTDHMKRETEKCEDLEDVIQLLDKFSNYYTDWKKYINELIYEYGASSAGKFSKLCGFSVNTVKKWSQSGDMPRSRKEFLKLGFGLSFDLDKMNKLLQRYGKYQKLYAKNIEDAVCIFAIKNKLSFYEFEQIKNEFAGIFSKIGEGAAYEKAEANADTEFIQSSLLEIKIKSELEKFIKKNYRVFSDAYGRLIGFIDAYIKINSLDFIDSQDGSLNSYLESQIQSPELVKNFNDMVSELRCHKTIPDKSKLIAFGLHLKMTPEDIDIMLGMAGMEPLCAKDKLESVLIYALNNIVVNNPGMEISNAMLLEKYSSDDRIQRHCTEIIRDHYEFELIDVIEYEMGDEKKRRGVPDSDDLIEYIKSQIRDLDMDGEHEFIRFLDIR